MALILANRVQELATANTTVSFTLTGAIQGFQSFSAIGNGNTTYYSATDGSGNWEVGLGTYSTTGPTLTRTTIYASSNSGLAVTFSGTVNVFVTYPSGRSVNLDASGNVSALGTVSSGTWQGSTVGVAYGGTGVTTSSGANSVVLRDANQNVTVNRVSQANTSTTAAGGTTALTAASSYIHTLVGTGGQTYTMPDATTLTTGVAFVFNNMATGTLTLQNFAAGAIGTIPAGGAGAVFLTDNSTTGGTWDLHSYLPEGVTFGTNAFNLGTSVISGGTWQGGTIQPGYGGTGLTTFTGANNALYSTGATTLTAGTLPVVAGGTGVTTTPANGQLLIGNGSSYTVASLGTGTGISTTTGAGTLTINNTGVTSLAGTSPVSASASTGAVTVSLASGYGDTQNPYASKTANFFLAAPNGSAGAPTFRAIVAADIPTLNQNTTGSAGSVANAVTFNNGGAGDASGTTFNGSAARTISYNTVGAPSTTGTNATGTWAINISGNAATATSATDSTKLPLSGGTMTGTISFNTAFNVQMWRHGSNGPGVRSDGTYLVLARGSGGGGDQQFYIDGFSNILKDGNIVLHAGNYNSYAPTLTGGGASGTWGISISGNAATVTNGVYTNNTQRISGIKQFDTANSGMASGSGDLAAAEAYGTGGGAFMAFHRPGVYAAYFGLDTDNVWKVGGWSMGANAYPILHSNNYNSYAPTLTGGGASGTWGISISGNSNTTNYVNNVGYGNGNFSWYQSSGNWQTWTGGWASHLISNHGDGSTYYNQTIIMPFWGPPQYMRKEGGTNVGPYVFLTTENYTSYSPSLTGTGASGTWGINITGTVNSLTLGLGSGSGSTNVAISSGALANNTSGAYNTAIGSSALNSISTTSQNTAVGGQAGLYALGTSNTWIGTYTGTNVTGSNNTAVGVSSMYGVFIQGSTAQGNSAIGFESLYSISSGGFNTAVGYRAGYSNTTGNITAVGNQAGYSNTTGGITAFGYQAGYNNTTQNSSTALGYQAMYNMRGNTNTATGYQAMYGSGTPANNTGSNNAAYGIQALYSLTTGAGNIANGYQALYASTTGSNNVATGYQALYTSVTASNNIAIGYQAYYSDNTVFYPTTGSANVGIGYLAAGYPYYSKSGSGNVAIGDQAAYYLNSGARNVAIGQLAGNNLNSGSDNVFMGYYAGWNSYGSNNIGNVYIGRQAGYSSGNNAYYNVAIGTYALDTPTTNSGYNVAVGVEALGNYTNYYATAVGAYALYSNTTGNYNVGLGYNVGYKITTGTYNIVIGNNAGYSDVVFSTTNGITTGNNNIYIGAFTYPSASTVSNEIVIGYGSTGKGANTGFINPNAGGVYQGNNSSAWSTTSDARIKENFVAVTNGLEVINALDPVEFDYILTGKHDVGFKAQQYMAVLPDQVQKHAASEAEKELVGDDEIYGIQRNLDPYLVSAIKSLTEQVKALQQEIAQLKGV